MPAWTTPGDADAGRFVVLGEHFASKERCHQRGDQEGTDQPDTRAASLAGYKRVAVGDLAVNIMLAWNGSLGISAYDGVVSPAYCVYRFRTGISALEKTLLYLYGTCEHLGEATLNHENRSIHFKPEPPTELLFEGFHVRERQIAVTQNGTSQATAKAVRLRSKPDSLASLVAVIEQSNQQRRFVEPGPASPRLFCRFPIRLSDFLPINAIIDGRFDLPQERDAILMEERDKEQIAEALSLLPSLVKLGLQDLWVGAHKLAFVGMPEKAFGEEIEAPLKTWWREQLAATARKLAAMPIVAAPDGRLCKPISDDTDQSPTCFLLPRFDTKQPKDELDYTDTWSVASELKSVTLPALDTARDWTDIATQWLTTKREY
jgi:hypothetical protein